MKIKPKKPLKRIDKLTILPNRVKRILSYFYEDLHETIADGYDANYVWYGSVNFSEKEKFEKLTLEVFNRLRKECIKENESKA